MAVQDGTPEHTCTSTGEIICPGKRKTKSVSEAKTSMLAHCLFSEHLGKGLLVPTAPMPTWQFCSSHDGWDSTKEQVPEASAEVQKEDWSQSKDVIRVLTLPSDNYRQLSYLLGFSVYKAGWQTWLYHEKETYVKKPDRILCTGVIILMPIKPELNRIFQNRDFEETGYIHRQISSPNLPIPRGSAAE